MASAFLGIASGLTQGLAQGIQTGSQLAIAKNQLDLQKAQASAQTLNGLSNAAKIPDPAMRTLAFQRLLPGVGIDPASDAGKQWITAMSKAGDESLKVAQQLFSDAGINGMDARTVGVIMADHPELLVQLAMQAGQKKTLGTIMSGLPAVFGGTAGLPQPTQPAGTGDMGTGTAGAGGTVVAPVVDAGTSAVGSQPAVSPAPAASPVTPAIAAPTTAQPPVATQPTTPTQPAAPIQPGTPSTTAQPAAAPSTGYAGAAPSVSVGKDHSGNILDWDPNSDPNVQGINTVIDKLMVAPGNNDAAITLLKDKRNQYIEGQKYLKSNYVEMLHLQLQNKEIGIASYNAQINAAGLQLRREQFAYTQKKDVREYDYREKIDIKNYDYRAGQDAKLADYKKKFDDRQYDYNKYRDELQQKVSEGNLSINQANLELAQKRQDFDEWKYKNTPLTAQGQMQWDIDHGFGPKGPMNTVDGGAPSDPTSGMKEIPTPSTMTSVANPAAHGDSNKDGTFTITDQALLPPGLIATQRLVWDSKTGKYYISTPTTTSMSTNEAQDRARTGQQTMNTGKQLLQQLNTMLNKDSTSFGTVGYGKTLAQTIIGEAKDISKLLNKDPAFLKYLGLDKLPYDPNAPTLEGFGILLRAVAARAVTDAGTGLGAYNMNAKDLDRITDLQSGSTDDVRQRLGLLGKLMDRAYDVYSQSLPTHSGETTPPVSTQLTPAKPDTSADPFADQPEKPKTPWNKMNMEERRPYIDTIHDGNASKWAPLKGHTTHYAKIPNGDIINLKLSLQKYPAPEQQAEIHKQFNILYGNGADAEVGYPP